MPGQCRVAGCCRVPGCCRVLPGAAGFCQAVRTCAHFRVLPGRLPGAAGLPGCRVVLSGLLPGCVLAAGLLTTRLI